LDHQFNSIIHEDYRRRLEAVSTYCMKEFLHQQATQLIIFASAYNLTLDAQGRVSLPPSLRQYAQVSDELVIVGVNTYFELWNKELWVAEKTLGQEQAWQIMEGLEER